MVKSFYTILVSALLFISLEGTAQVTKNNPTNNACISVPKLLSNIVITETLNNDFDIPVGLSTIVFEAVNGTLVTEQGNATFSPSLGLVNANISSTTITLTFTPSGTGHLSTLETLTLSNLRAINNSPGTMEIRYVSSTFPINGLTANDVVATVETLPSPVAPIITGSSEVCMFEEGVNYSADPLYSNYQWTINGGEIVSGDNTESIVVNWTASEAYSLQLTYANAAGCITEAPGMLNVSISLVDEPIVGGPLTSCVNSTIEYSTEDGKSNYSWSFPGGNLISGGGPGDQTVTIQWGASPTSASVSVTYDAENGCGSPSGFLNLSVEDNGPTAPNTTAPAVCSSLNTSFDLQDHVTTNGNGFGGFYEFVAADNTFTNGEPLSTVNSSYINNAVTTLEGSVQNVVYTVTGTNQNSGCIGTPFTVTIPINPVPIGKSALTEVCSGIGIVYNPQNNVNSGAPANGVSGTFTWTSSADPEVTGNSLSGSGTITDVLVNPTDELHAAYYSITGTSLLGCVGPAFEVVIHANPLPLIEGPSTVCEGSPFFFYATNPAGTYTWGATGTRTIPSGGLSTDYYIELDWSAGTSETVSVTYINSYGCSGLATLPVSITTLTPVGATDVTTGCGDSPINFNPQTTINTFGNSIPASSFSWVATNNANTTGESLTPQTDPLISDAVTNTLGSSEPVIYMVTPTGACGAGAPFQVTVNVNPTPVGSLANVVSCTGTQINYDLQSNINGNNGLTSTFSWYAADNPNTEGESQNPQTSSVIEESPFIYGGPTSALIVYTVTPTSAGCEGQPFTVNVTRQMPPSLSTSTFFPSICSGVNPNYDLQNLINTDGNSVTTTFSWHADPEANVTGESVVPQNSAFINDLLIVTSGAKPTVVYTVDTESASGACAGPSFSVQLKVNAAPQPPSPTETICSDQAQSFDIQTYLGSETLIPVSSISWVAAPNANVTGETTTSQATTSITDVVKNVTGLPENVVYTITATSPDGCAGVFTQTVTVNPNPATVITNSSPGVSNNNSTNITLTSNVATASFDFTATAPPAISGATAGTGTAITQLLSNSSASQQVVTYTVTATANGCIGAAFVTTVTINGMRTIITADSVALVVLYNALSGANWTQSSNWLSGAANTWSGVDVSSERVTGLSLSSNNLTGTLPSAIGNLSALQTLDIRDNELSGTLPAELYNLTTLTQLRLSGNDFTGAILPAITNLTSLQTLQAENLPMTAQIPSEVFELTSLVNLGLSGKVNGPLPETFGNLTSLLTFRCDSCAIISIPPSITSLVNLVSLRLFNNSIGTLPNMSSLPLNYLDVGKNSLTFESLEPYTSVQTFVYSPQDTVGVASTVVLQTTTPHNFVSAVGGTANQFAWKKNNATIPSVTTSTYTISSPVFEDEGIYHSEVTNASLPDLTITTSPVTAKVSSLKRDSLSLLQIYNTTGGASWSNKTGWTSGRLNTWSGVVITSDRVTALNLPNNNLTGILPVEFTDLRSLQTANLSTNKLSEIPTITSMSALTNLNVSSNNLSFGTLEPNAPVFSKLTYSPQGDIGVVSQDSIAAGSPVEFSAITTGANNTYLWKRNDSNVSGATSNTLIIASIDRQNMGQYICEIKNSVVPNLTLQTAPKTILATATLSGKLLVESGTSAKKGKVSLFRVNPAGAFVIVKTQNVEEDGTYAFPKVVLDEYQVQGFADTLQHLLALPTYYPGTILWEEADTLSVVNTLSNINIISQFKPEAPSGRGSISGTVIEEIKEGGRTKRPIPVRNSGVSARRVQSTGRGQEEILILVAYVFSNENGEFALGHLPNGNYRLNIQYPGFPMDEKSFINISIGPGLASEVKVEAIVDKGLINVRQMIVTSVWSNENYTAEVFPNPTSSVIQMKFGARSSYRDIGIFDISGKQIRKINAYDEILEVNVATFSKGMYLLRINEKGKLVKSLHVIIE
jgi:Leucine-rich repeat (LRR) protein